MMLKYVTCLISLRRLSLDMYIHTRLNVHSRTSGKKNQTIYEFPRLEQTFRIHHNDTDIPNDH